MRDEAIEVLQAQLRTEAGREDAFRALFERFYWPLCRFFEQRGFTSEECQDLFQETFLRAFRGIEAFRGESRWEHWLFRVAANTAIKALRHRCAAKRAGREIPLPRDHEGGDPSPLADSHPGRTAEPLRRLLGREAGKRALKAIAGLPAQMRRCVRLRALQELDYEEIAEVLALTPSTVKVQLFKARRRLREELGEAVSAFDW